MTMFVVAFRAQRLALTVSRFALHLSSPSTLGNQIARQSCQSPTGQFKRPAGQQARVASSPVARMLISRAPAIMLPQLLHSEPTILLFGSSL